MKKGQTKSQPQIHDLPSESLRVFLTSRVVGNIYIIDPDGLIRFWIKNFRNGALMSFLNRGILEKGFLAICTVLEKACTPEVLQEAGEFLRSIIVRNYPLALVPNCKLCVMPECEGIRTSPLHPACAAHTCPHCVKFVDWATRRPTYAEESKFQSLGKQSLVHLIPRTTTGDELEMGRIMRICANMWRCERIEMDIVCPGDLQPCRGCKSMVLPHLVRKNGPIASILQYCSACWIADKCRYCKDSNAHLRASATEDKERHDARVCCDPKCVVRGCCKVCQKVWFQQPPSKAESLLLLCGDCQRNHLICHKCKRIAPGTNGGIFFAQNWVYGTTKPHPSAVYCIFCFEHAPKMITQSKTDLKACRRRALLIQWRLFAKRERAFFEASLKKDMRATLQHMLEPTLGDRERTMARIMPDVFWGAVQDHCELWDCTYWLMYQMALLPRDVWLMIMSLIAFGSTGVVPSHGPTMVRKPTFDPYSAGLPSQYHGPFDTLTREELAQIRMMTVPAQPMGLHHYTRYLTPVIMQNGDPVTYRKIPDDDRVHAVPGMLPRDAYDVQYITMDNDDDDEMPGLEDVGMPPLQRDSDGESVD